MRTTLTQNTTDFLDRAIEELYKKQLLDWPLYRRFHYHWEYRGHGISVEQAREFILELEAIAIKSEGCEHSHSELSKEVDPAYPVYSEIVEIAPIYEDAVSLEFHKPIVNPSQIPGLLYLLRIPGHREGMDIENHNFGYHFHYGKIKSGTLIRTNLLLTFNSNDLQPEQKETAKNDSQPEQKETAKEVQPPLYFEYHAEGKNKPVDAECIGVHKRRPIYFMCLDIGKKRGLANFKPPANKSRVFFDIKCISV